MKINPLHKVIGGIVAGLVALAIISRQEPGPEPNPLKVEREYDRVVVIGIDCSASFIGDVTGPEARAYKFMLRVIDKYMQSNGREKLVLVQLSGNAKPLIWDGTPADLKKRFPNPASMRDFLVSKSDVNYSRLADGVTDSLLYVETIPGLTSKTKCVALFLTDWEDTTSAVGHEQRLQAALTTWGKRDGAVGYYYVELNQAAKHRAMLQNAGVRHFIVSSGIEESPPLPSFE